MSLIERGRPLMVPLALLVYGLILVLGNVRGLGQTLAPDTSDKTLHLLAYGGLSALLYLGLRLPPLRRSAIILGVIALLGAVDETVQAFVPYRDADLRDWLADLAGAALVCALLSLLRAMMPRRYRRR